MKPLTGKKLESLIQDRLGITLEKLCQELGNKNISKAYVWRQHGISKKACVSIEIFYEQRIKAHELRPDIFIGPDFTPSPEQIHAAQRKLNQLSAMEQ